MKARLRSALDQVAGPIVGSTTSVRTARTQVVLTFDDGPHLQETPRLLDVLARHRAHATFFVLLTRVRQAPDLTRRLIEDGHEVGLHGADHRRWTTGSLREVCQRISSAQAELAQVTGRPVRYVRPPHGAQSPATNLWCRRLGMSTILWDSTTWDWKDVPHQDRLNKAMQARAGSILLAHDGMADASDLSDEVPTVTVDKAALLDEVLTEFGRRGLHIVTLSQALADGRAVRRLSFAK